MRPQHITAETAVLRAGIDDGNIGFNEAAAYNCGNRRERRAPPTRVFASMRPQHITAETAAGREREGGPDRASMRPQHITAETEPVASETLPAARLQ